MQAPSLIKSHNQWMTGIRRLWPIGLLCLMVLIEVFEHLFLPMKHTIGGLFFWVEVFLYGTVIGGFFLLLLHSYSKSGDELGKVNQTLEQVNISLQIERAARRKLLASVIEAQEGERKRITRELHDSIGQSLTAFLLTSTPEDDLTPQQSHHLRLARRAAEEALESMRRLILDLRPALLDTQGLLPALHQCARRTLQNADIQVDIQTEGNVNDLPEPVEIALFRIAQEAFTNILRHAKTKKVSIWLKRQPAQIELSIRDYGKGFFVANNHTPPPASGIGLFNIRERAEQLGGQFELVSLEGQGTTITVTMPIDTLTEVAI